MNILVDTHIALWYLNGDSKLPKKAAQHNDPFDRILICQAKAENMTFLTHDSLLSDYNEKTVEIV